MASLIKKLPAKLLYFVICLIVCVCFSIINKSNKFDIFKDDVKKEIKQSIDSDYEFISQLIHPMGYYIFPGAANPCSSSSETNSYKRVRLYLFRKVQKPIKAVSVSYRNSNLAHSIYFEDGVYQISFDELSISQGRLVI